MITEVGILLAQCPDQAVNGVTVSLLIYTYSLPPILLVVQFHGGTLGRFHEVLRGITREALEVAVLSLGKNVISLSLNSLVCLELFRVPLVVYSPMHRR
jgi:hypothetical protein